MKDRLGTILRSNRIILTSLVLGTFCGLASVFAYLINNESIGLLQLFVNIFIVLSLYITFVSYVRHDKNVMKFTLGSILTLVIVAWVIIVMDETSNLFTLLFVLLSIIIYLIHMLINADRRSSPELVKINQVVCVIYVIATIIGAIYLLINFTYYTLAAVSADILYMCALLACVFIETNLDTYRIAREAKGWKEPK